MATTTTTVTIDRYRTQALGWWRSRSPREQILLAALMAVATIALYLSFVLAPLQAVRREAIADIAAYEALSAQLRVSGPALLSRAAVQTGDRSTAIAASAAQAGLAIRRIDPDGERTRVVMQDVAFDSLIRWLDRLERERGLRIADLRIERRPTPGVVSAQVLVEQP